MGTDVCPVCGKGGGEAVLCFYCNGCPADCKCDATAEIMRQVSGGPLTAEEYDEGAHQQEQHDERARR